MSNKRPAEIEVAHSKRSNFVMRERQNDRMSVFADSANCTEQPMDLSNKPTTGNSLLNGNSREVPSVVTIDSEDEPTDDISRERLRRELEEELFNEETKLILLKQLRHNQRQHLKGHQPPAPITQNHTQAHQAQPAHTQPSANKSTSSSIGKSGVNNVQAHSGAHSSYGRSSHAANPTPSAHSHAQNHSTSAVPQTKRSNPVPSQPTSTVRSTPQVHSSNNLTATPRQPQVPNNTPSASAVTTTPAPPPPPPKPVVLDEAQKQSARGALRRQLEKTLLAIPPPKPLPPELSFIPSLISNDFVKLLGLEEVVKMLLDIQRQEKRDVKYVFNPFRCSQCKSDFTPVWKREKPGSKNVICEQCVTSNQKRNLRQEHTARLKNAFLKAAEQQQELEEQLKKNHIPSSLTAMMPSALQPHSTPSHVNSSRQQHHQQEKTPSSVSSHHREQRDVSHARDAQHAQSQNAAAAAAVAALTSSQASSSSTNVNAAAAQLASQLFPQQLGGVSASQSILGMAYIQQQLAALTSQPSNFGLNQAVVAAAAALNPSQRQLLLDQLSQQGKQFNWK